MRCPVCFVPLTRTEEQGVKVRLCSSCFGAFINPFGLKRLASLDPDNVPAPQGQASIEDLAALVAESDHKAVLRCPECEVPMGKGRFHPMIRVQIDVCPKCKSAWLDAGELRLIQTLYHELLTSDDPKLVALREKIATVKLEEAGWAQDRRNLGSVDWSGMFSTTPYSWVDLLFDL